MEKDNALHEEESDLSSKHELIANACRAGDIDELVSLANSTGGLLDDRLRATAC